ncbi:DUF2235 domain-containing protein [Hydrogenophaga electricum]|uniref:DUF2235 domain-containing protein n=1 Tax=Hydrogenophaga electricum TaxID=1230953 RepID=A0ABQ6CB63_9BURK|nr:DUF2235 domain-containing protein [Hydrogenophaga electricum]GLS15929.1 hypothetical protein GCM10007935_33660 [Hydrogenophaga electricum]
MTEVIKHLSAAEREQMSAQARRIAETPATQVDARSGEKFVFVAHFDGTNNDKGNIKLSGNPHQTNVADLHDQMAPQMRGNDNFRSAYYPGVGTDAGVKGYRDVLLPSEEMRSTAVRAYNEFNDQAAEWLREHPQADPITSLQVMATGFSRGGGTAAVFSQLLYENGLTDPKTGQQLVPPGQLGLAGALILDPVTTGYGGNVAFSPASKNITVVRAQNEYREWFKGVDHSAHPGVTTVEVMGNHCNIGGGYDRGISARVLEGATEWFRRGGVPIRDVLPEKRHDGTAAVYHERDIPKTDQIAQASRSTIARAMWPAGSLMVEGAAEAADYPVTHDPRQGLHAQRQLDPVARPEMHVHDGWRRFQGAEATVWRKAYPLPNGQTASTVMVERDFPGRDRDRIDMHLLQTDEQGQTRELLHRRAPLGQGNDLRHQLDAAMPGAEPRRLSPAQESGAQKFREQLGPQLRQLGMNEQQVDALAAAAMKEQMRHLGQGANSQFLLSRDGSTIGLLRPYGLAHEFSVAQALGQSEQAHWREAADWERHGLAQGNGKPIMELQESAHGAMRRA